MKKCYFVFGFLLLTSTIFAQGKLDEAFTKSGNSRQGYSAYLFTLHIDQASGLTNLLRSNDYPEMNQFGFEYGIQLGFGRQYSKINGLVSLSYYSRATLESATTNNSANFMGWRAGIGIEYKLFEKKLGLRPS